MDVNEYVAREPSVIGGICHRLLKIYKFHNLESIGYNHLRYEFGYDNYKRAIKTPTLIGKELLKCFFFQFENYEDSVVPGEKDLVFKVKEDY